MKALYVGILTAGTTSRQRADALRGLINRAQWDCIDTDQEFQSAGRLARSAAFRLRMGPVPNALNARVRQLAAISQYDLIWVDKAVYLWPSTVERLRKQAKVLIHYTPDTAFRVNRSRHFEASADFYDLLVTTKSFELPLYHQHVDPSRVMLTTQAYDAGLHRPLQIAGAKLPAATFIGLCEPDRERCMDELMRAGIPVRVGGEGWQRACRKHRNNPHFHFLGQKVFGLEYANAYASSVVGLGLLSQRFPELHTTRTFEIPACGALLATPRTDDTRRFFDETEAVFFDGYAELAERLVGLFADRDQARLMADRGTRRVRQDGRHNQAVLMAALQRFPGLI